MALTGRSSGQSSSNANGGRSSSRASGTRGSGGNSKETENALKETPSIQNNKEGNAELDAELEQAHQQFEEENIP